LARLEDFFLNHEHRPINKWVHYFEIYERHFEKYRHRDVTLIEIGIAGGGSLQMWKWYFGPQAKIIGVDVSANTAFKEEQIECRIFSQRDVGSLKSLPDADIVIDDGGHRYLDQKPSFDVLYPKTKGIYLIEDTHTAYMPNYHPPGKETIINQATKDVDRLHGWHYGQVDELTKTTRAIHFYDSIVVYEKGDICQPESKVI
jgi:hypothetical protein